MTKTTIAIFQISTEEDLRFQLDFLGLNLTERTLKTNVRRRDTNALVQALTAPSNMTLVGSGNLTVFYPRASMSAWAKTEYEADILDETGGSATRIMAVRFVYDEPGKLVYGVRGNQATVTFAENQATVTAIGGVGPPGPANVITIGDVDTLETGEEATASLTGAAPAQALNLGLPKGATGTAATIAVGGVTTVAPGEDATVTNSGTSGAAVFDFEIPAGAAATIAVGDVATGEPGSLADVTNSGTSSAAIFDFTIPQGDKGEKGWSPQFAVEDDGARRVLRVTGWAGGEGTAPATGDYVGATGPVPDIEDGIDVRGPAGAATVAPGSIGTEDLADGLLSADAAGRAKMANGFTTFALMQDIATSRLLGRVTAGSGDIEEVEGDEATSLLSVFTGDSGAGGAKGLVPAPGAGDAAKVLTGAGTWQELTVALPAGYLAGLSIANDTTDATNDIVVKPGAARDSGDARNLVLTVDNIKRIDAAFAEYTLPGTASGGRSSSDNLTGAKWFHVYLIGGAGKNTQPFFATSLTPTLPTGFTEWRRVGSVWWTGSGIKGFSQVGRRFYFTNPDGLDADTTTLGATASLFTVRTPSGLKCVAVCQVYSSHASAFAGVRVSDPDTPDLAPSLTVAPLASIGGGGGTATAGEAQVLTNTSSQVRARAVNSSTTFRMATLGWIDEA